jgi:hypothetical protein
MRAWLCGFGFDECHDPRRHIGQQMASTFGHQHIMVLDRGAVVEFVAWTHYYKI